MDEVLIKQCLRKNRRAQNKLYKELFSYIMNICIRYKYNYDDAGAALNSIFLKILNGLNSYQRNRPFLPWVKTIAVRHLIDEHRSRIKNEMLQLELADMKKSNNPSEDHEDDLLGLIQNLPLTTREVFNLYAIDGYKYREIAEMLQIPEGTAKWHVSVARKKLGLMLTQEINKVKQIHY